MKNFMKKFQVNSNFVSNSKVILYISKSTELQQNNVFNWKRIIAFLFSHTWKSKW